MVSSVTGNSYATYLSQLQGGGAASASQDSGQSLVSSLLGDRNAFTPSVVSLVRPNASGEFDPVSSLLGGSSPNHAVTSLYSNLYASVSAATLTQAQDFGSRQADAEAAPANPVQSLIAQLTQASVAYNRTLQQSAAEVLRANSGVIPIVT